MSENEPQEHMIPKSRLDAKNRIIEELQAELAGTKDQAQKAAVAAAGWQSRAEGLQEIAKERDEAIAKASKLEKEYAENDLMGGAGIKDKYARNIVRSEYEEAKAQNPSIDFATFFDKFKESPPEILQPYFKPAADPTAPTATAAPTTPPVAGEPPPPVRVLPGNEKTTPPPAPVGEWDPKAIRENYKEHRSELLETKVV